MTGVNEVDALPRCVQKIMILDIGGDKGVAPHSNGSILTVSTGTAAYRYPVKQLLHAGENRLRLPLVPMEKENEEKLIHLLEEAQKI